MRAKSSMAPTDPSTTTDRLFALQALRAIAAILVTIAHASEESKHYFGFQPIFDTDPLGKGVDLFFVLSGFIIYFSSVITNKSLPINPRSFLLQRFIRVAPLYFIFTTLLVGVIYLTPSGVKEAIFDPLQILTSYLFLPYERYDGRIAPTLSLGWTLNYEMFFYLVFAFSLLLKPNRAAAICITIIAALAILGIFIPSSYPAPIREWTDGIVLEFAFGIIIAKTYQTLGRPKKTAWKTIMFLNIIGFGLLYFLNLPEKPFPLPRFVSAGIPSALIVASWVLFVAKTSDKNVPRILTALGDSSYSLYLSHRFVQRPIQMLLRKSELASSPSIGVIYLIAAVLGACIAGHFVYRKIEVPLLKYLRRVAYRNASS
ncbi:acyltransferase family protein [Hydrogenophaga sp. ZJX-1]|uniref:acyltransferase family protein n=1 Tax=Hydrogenophaga sp. ZJX-1 TaxID=3404778 RepID=UPI003B2827D5